MPGAGLPGNPCCQCIWLLSAPGAEQLGRKPSSFVGFSWLRGPAAELRVSHGPMVGRTAMPSSRSILWVCDEASPVWPLAVAGSECTE